jgi:ATP-dependent RNA helicase DHX57
MEDRGCHERRRGAPPFQSLCTVYVRPQRSLLQTSITIDDIVYVIDSGKVKETRYDPESGLTKLVEQWTTHAAGRQRRGRAGRTRPGVCYKLYTRWRERKMEQFPRPEILRVPLESICLAVKATRENEDVKV